MRCQPLLHCFGIVVLLAYRQGDLLTLNWENISKILSTFILELFFLKENVMKLCLLMTVPLMDAIFFVFVRRFQKLLSLPLYCLYHPISKKKVRHGSDVCERLLPWKQMWKGAYLVRFVSFYLRVR